MDRHLPRPITTLLLLLAREFEVERRTLAWAGSAGFLALQMIIVLGMGFSAVPPSDVSRRLALAALWLAFLFAGSSGINRSMAGEHQGGALAGLLLLPINRALLYLAKVLSSLLFLAAALALMLIAGRLFLSLPPGVFSPAMITVLALAALGYAAVGTLIGAMTASLKGRDALLAILLLPIVVPLFLAATSASQSLALGGGFAEVQGEIRLLGSFAALYLGLGLGLFGRVVEG